MNYRAFIAALDAVNGGDDATLVDDAATYRAGVSQPALDPSFPSPGTKHHAKHMETFRASGELGPIIGPI